jgi:hypothetical protein
MIILRPAQSAAAIVEGTDNPLGTASSCASYPALLVTPPNLTTASRVAVSGLGGIDDQGLPGCSQIEVHPLLPGRSGRSS